MLQIRLPLAPTLLENAEIMGKIPELNKEFTEKELSSINRKLKKM